MATAALEIVDTRTRLIDVAIELFTRHSFAGTSLQMIADGLGFTKAAIYHHFRTREQLLAAVVEPMLADVFAAAGILCETPFPRLTYAEAMELFKLPRKLGTTAAGEEPADG